MTFKNFAGSLIIVVIGSFLTIYSNEIKELMNINKKEQILNLKDSNEVVVETKTSTKLEFVEEKPPWCYTNEKSINNFKIDEYFICMNKDIWEYENRYVYKFKIIHRKLNSDNREKLILFKDNWLKYRRTTCVSSVKLCIDSHKDILNKLIKIFDK